MTGVKIFMFSDLINKTKITQIPNKINRKKNNHRLFEKKNKPKRKT